MNETEKMPKVNTNITTQDCLMHGLAGKGGAIVKVFESEIKDLESFCTQQAEKIESWVEFAYKQGLKLDRFMPFFGIDNKERISKAIELLIKYDSEIKKLEEEKREAVELLTGLKESIHIGMLHGFDAFIMIDNIVDIELFLSNRKKEI